MRPTESDKGISARWHSHTRAKAYFGFYDSRYQIALLPDHNIDPHEVIEHEMTHVNLVTKSSLGLLERILVFFNWKAREQRRASAEDTAQSLLNVVMAATEVVHEGTAWFGTELLRGNDANLSTPSQYAKEAKRLRVLFENMPEKPFSDLRSDPVSAMNIADEIAIYALSPPAMEDLWSQPKTMSVRTLQEVLSSKGNDPLARFKQICSHLSGVPFPVMHSWFLAMNSDSETNCRSLPSSNRGFRFLRRAASVPAVFRSDLYKRGDIARFLRALAECIGMEEDDSIIYWNKLGSEEDRMLAAFEGELPSEVIASWRTSDPIVKSFSSFEVTHGIDVNTDRYSQVCILEPSRPYRERRFEDHSSAEAALKQARYLLVTLERTGEPHSFGFFSPDVDHAFLSCPVIGSSGDNRLFQPTLRVDLKTAHEVLHGVARAAPIIASSVGYDFGMGDYAGLILLKDVPHVVVTIRDFRSLWFGLGRGLAGSTLIDWCPMPSPSGRKHFGFLVMKPSGKQFPIILNPTIIWRYDRVISVADRLPSTFEVKLKQVQGSPYEWLGAMTDTVMTAASVFEVGAREDAIAATALLNVLSRASGRDFSESSVKNV